MGDVTVGASAHSIYETEVDRHVRAPDETVVWHCNAQGEASRTILAGPSPVHRRSAVPARTSTESRPISVVIDSTRVRQQPQLLDATDTTRRASARCHHDAGHNELASPFWPPTPGPLLLALHGQTVPILALMGRLITWIPGAHSTSMLHAGRWSCRPVACSGHRGHRQTVAVLHGWAPCRGTPAWLAPSRSRASHRTIHQLPSPAQLAGDR